MGLLNKLRDVFDLNDRSERMTTPDVHENTIHLCTYMKSHSYCRIGTLKHKQNVHKKGVRWNREVPEAQ